MALSLRSAAVVGLAALALVASAGTGAVAGRLITSEDIEDGTIQTRDLGIGSVGWARVSEGMQQRIARLAGQDGATGATGATGPAGPQGEQGPIGPVGPRGPRGSEGMSLAGYEIYLSEETPDDVVAELDPQLGSGITLPSGSYLVTLNGLTAGSGAMYAGSLDDEGELAVLHACFTSEVGVIFFGFSCRSTYPLRVAPGAAPYTVTGYSLSTDFEDSSPAPDGLVEVVVYATSGDLPDTLSCGCRPSERRLDRAMRDFERRLTAGR